MRSRTTVVAALCSLGLIGLAAAALADGCFVPAAAPDRGVTVTSAAQKAVLLEEHDEEILLLQTTYRGPARRFAWVVPVPSAPREVFTAESAFLDKVFEWTEPRLATWLDEPARRVTGGRKGTLTAAPPAAGMAGGAGEPGAQQPPPVQVLQRLAVGDYQAIVLAARDSRALENWLRTNRFALPTGAQSVFAEYVQRGWVFVAVKLLDKVAAGQPTITEVAPLGLRFARPRDGLVYPLTISRLSSPPLCSLLLVVISDGAQTCRTLPVVRPHRRYRLRRGETLGDFRRAMTRVDDKPSLLCEYSAPRALGYADLGYRQEDWSRGLLAGAASNRYATRFFGLLAPAEMTDLTFVPDGTQTQDYHLLVQRRGRPQPDAWELLKDTAGQTLRAGRGLATVAPVRRPGPPTDSRGLLLLVGALLLVGLVAAALVSGKLKLWGALLPLLLVAVAVIPTGRRAVAGGDPNYSPLYVALNVVTQAATYFREDTGLWPLTVDDLVAPAKPAEGCDASGNRLPVPDSWRGPYLSYGPQDPLGGPRLVIDPLNNRLVDSGGFAVTISGATQAQLDAAAASAPPSGTQYWRATPESLNYPLADYAAWLRGRSAAGSRLGEAFEHWGQSGFSADFEGTMVCDTVGHELWLFGPERAAVLPGGGLIYGAVAASVADAAGQERDPRSFLQATTPQGTRLLTPRLLPLWVHGLAASPDQRVVVVRGVVPPAPGEYRNEHVMYRLDATGRLSPPLYRGQIERWLVANDRGSVYLLNRHDATCDLVRLPLGGGAPAILKSGTDCDLLQQTDRGILIGGAKRELGVLDSAGMWHAVALPEKGELAAVQAHGGEIALATLGEHFHGSYPQGRPDKKCLTVSIYLSSLATGQCRLIGSFPVVDPPRRLALFPVSAAKVGVFVGLNSSGQVYVEVGQAGVQGWKLESRRLELPSGGMEEPAQQYTPASAPFKLGVPEAAPVPALDDIMKQLR